MAANSNLVTVLIKLVFLLSVITFLILDTTKAEKPEIMGWDAHYPTKSCSSGRIGDCETDVDQANDAAGHRRLLQQPGGPYFISYGSLSADRTPCPPLSGRSYYTAYCNAVSGPVDPYERGCSVITDCARDFS